MNSFYAISQHETIRRFVRRVEITWPQSCPFFGKGGSEDDRHLESPGKVPWKDIMRGLKGSCDTLYAHVRHGDADPLTEALRALAMVGIAL